MIAVNHHPWSIGPGQRCKRLDEVECAAAAEEHLADKDEAVVTGLGLSQEPIGEAVERLDRDTLDHRGASLFPPRELTPRAVELAVGGKRPDRPCRRGRREQA